ncbi:recombinase family protein [Streptomyces cadmiisoli]|nr:recombinase family protein [Streptomyces cadmiisoli]
MARVSTAEQADGYGIKIQVTAGEDYISRQPGWILPPELVFIDEGVSGSIIDRPEMLRLEEMARAGLIDVIVVHKFDRIGRTGRAFWTWIWAMEDLGISFVSVTQNIDSSTKFGKQQLQFYAMMAEAEWDLIRDRTVNGRNTAALEGRWPSGTPAYGHKTVGARKRRMAVVCKKEAKVIKLACELIVDQGMNAEDAARELNARGCRTRTGAPWQGPNLTARLKSETISGTFIYRNPDKSGNRVKMNIDGTPLYGDSVEIKLPKILGKKRHNALLAALKLRSRPKTSAYDYPLSTRIKSGCGHYTGRHDAKSGTRFYHCTTGGTGCNDMPIDANTIEQAVWGKITETINDRKQLERIAQDWVRKIPGDIDDKRKRVDTLSKSVGQIETNLVTATVNLATMANLTEEIKAAALDKLNSDLTAEKELLKEAQRILKEHEAVEARVSSVMAVVETAQAKIREISLSEMREVMEIFRIEVELLGELKPNRPGVPCKVSTWHKADQVPVPDFISEEEWPEVESFLRATLGRRMPFVRSGPPLRVQINGALYRLRHDCAWSEVPEEYGTYHTLKKRQEGLWEAGVWPQLVKTLNQRRLGVAMPTARYLPGLVIRGELVGDLRLVGTDAATGEQSSTRPTRATRS